MVGRPPIENWSRPELENQYHAVLNNYRDTQKKNKELEKKITQINSRFRRSILDRKAQGNGVIDKEKYDEVLRDNELLLMKLKTTKHQLLTYTTPTARAATLSAMTGRSTGRPQSTMRKFVPPGNTDRSQRGDDSNAGKSQDRASFSGRVNETNLAEKANVIKLNRILRQKNSEIAELKYEIERLNSQIQAMSHEFESITSQSVFKSEQDVIVTNRTNDSSASNEFELARQELIMVKKELGVLKEANERLVKQSLNYDLGNDASDSLELKKKIAVLEENLRESERRERETSKKRRHERRQYEDFKKRCRLQMKTFEKREHIIATQQTQSGHIVDESTPRSDRSFFEDSYSRKRRGKLKQEKSDDVLLRLYNDVVGILESHSGGREAFDIFTDETDTNSHAKWQKMYAELYDELEKVRSMLLVQHNINQKQNSEINLLHEECERLRVTAEKKLNEMREQLQQKHQEVILLEEKIRAIAYAGQKPIALKGKSQEGESQTLSSEMSVRLTSVQFNKNYYESTSCSNSCPSSIFFSLEFFDFELQITPHLPFVEKQPMDHTTVYHVVCSNLLIHYLQTNGITIEMYRPHGNTYNLLASAVINLSSILKKKYLTKYQSTASLIDTSTGSAIATLTFEVLLSQDLNKAVSSYQQAEVAQKMLPLEIKNEEENLFDYLTVNVHRCLNINKISNASMEVCLVYELLAFSPYFTDTVIATGVAEFGSRKDWPVPTDQVKHLREQEILFFIVNTSEDKKGDGILAVLSLPFAPLLNKQAIRGSFNMMKPDGTDSGLQLDVSIFWKLAPPDDGNNNKVATSSSTSTLITTSVPQVTKQNTRVEKPNTLPVLRQPSPTSTYSSPPNSANGRSPSVIESDGEEEIWEESAVVEIVRSPSSSSSSSKESSVRTVEEVDESFAHSSRPIPSAPSEEKHEKELTPPPKLQSPSTSSSSSDDNSQSSAATYTKEGNGSIEKEGSIESDGMTVESEAKREHDRNEIRSLLGDLPPIAKPRLSKQLEDGFSPASLSKSRTYSEEHDVSVGSYHEEESLERGNRNVVFTHPLHHSIPPSEASSLSSPRKGRREKSVVPLPEDGGRSVIKSVPKPLEMQFPNDDTPIGVVTFYIDKIYNMEFSPLMHPSFRNIKLYIDWTFLDFPQEECRVLQSKTIDRSEQPLEIRFNFKKEYYLSRKRVALLEQYIELQNKLEFCLMTDTEDDSEELGVALLELVRNPSDQIISLSILDVSGIKYADIDLALFFNESMFDRSNMTSL